MGKTCFDCGKKLGYGDVIVSEKDLKKNKSKCGFTDELISRMTEKDVLCIDCKQKYSIRHALEIYNCIKKNNSEKDFESCRNDEYLQPIIIEAERLLAEQNKDVDALYNKGVALSTFGKHAEAIVYYDRLLDIDPKDVYALTNKGVALSDLGKYEEGEEYFAKAKEL